MPTTEDINTPRQEGIFRNYPIKASTTLYVGALVAIDATGFAVNGADTAGLIHVGIAQNNGHSLDNSGGSSGDLNVSVDNSSDFLIEFGGTATQADVGVLAYAVNNDSVDLVGVTTNDILVGRIVEFVDATHVWVNQRVATDNDA